MIRSTATHPDRRRFRKRVLLNGFILLLFALLTATIAYAYISHENSYYFWDYAAYHDMTVEKALYLRSLSAGSLFSNLGDVLRGIWESTARDYSDLHTLPAVPFILLFGSSRIVYILTLAIGYLLPFALVVGAIATRLFPSQPRAIVFWSAALLTLLLPTTWIPTLRGYPDTLSAAFIGLALFVYVQDLRLSHAWQIIAIGLCTAIAILIRRHFVYAGISLLAAMVLQGLLTFALGWREHRQRALRRLLVAGGRIGLAATSLLFFLALLGWPFIQRVIQTDFGQLYASYAVPFRSSFQYYQAYVGWIACALALVGFLGALRSRAFSSPVVTFLLFFSVFSAGQWLLIVRQLGIHYTLHMTWGIIFGLVALAGLHSTAFATRTRRLASGFLVTTFLAFNFFNGLATTNVLDHLAGRPQYSEALKRLFSANHAPLYRSDQQELIRLIDYLRQVAAPDDPIFVAASSFLLNDDLLWHAQNILREPALTYPVAGFWRSHNLKVLRWVPFVDSRDAYPLELLLQSQFVVVASPFQHHLAQDEQEVLKMVVDAFNGNWEIAEDFSPLPRQFSLAGNVKIVIYERARPTSLGTTLRTLWAMRDYTTEPPGGQLDLIKVSGASESYVTEAPDGTLEVAVAIRAPYTSFLHLDRIDAPTSLTGRLDIYDPRCSNNVMIETEMVDDKGQVIGSAPLFDAAQENNTFSKTLHPPKSAYLLFTLVTDYDPDTSEPCWIVLKEFTIRNQQGQSTGHTDGYFGRESSQTWRRENNE